MHSESSAHHKLGQVAATAICGNDILSSALYVSGIAILFAGIYAPLVLLGIGFVLYLYKKVYTEVVEALPVNGGAYNCLLNGTSKIVAAMAGVMTLLSYVATAVISAKVGVEYLNIGVQNAALQFLHQTAGLQVIPVTIFILFCFALLVITGVKDSARVAIGIFFFHILTLLLFLGFGVLYALHGTSYLAANIVATNGILLKNGGILTMLVLAFSASLLGVSGFESSANFVEEQQRGVFRKTLRNMLIGVTFFNPLIALVVLQSMPYAKIVAANNYLLADAAFSIGGAWLRYLVAADAFLVLCGAVLTAYVGVSGLLQRMSADGCIPIILSKKNSRGSFPRIVIAFFLLCSSILLLTHGDLLSLAGVYTIAFLGVMSLFALGNLILREGRNELKRTYRAPMIAVIIAFLATIMGIVGNIRIDPNNLVFFAMYFVPVIFIVLCVVYQHWILRILLRLTKWLPPVHDFFARRFVYISEGHFVAFVHHVYRLQATLDYIARNEGGCKVTIVHCSDGCEHDEQHLREIRAALPHLQKAGFYPHFTIDVMTRKGKFGPAVINDVAHDMHMPKNRFFIGSIGAAEHFDYSDLGGVRIIFG